MTLHSVANLVNPPCAAMIRVEAVCHVAHHKPLWVAAQQDLDGLRGFGQYGLENHERRNQALG